MMNMVKLVRLFSLLFLIGIFEVEKSTQDYVINKTTISPNVNIESSYNRIETDSPSSKKKRSVFSPCAISSSHRRGFVGILSCIIASNCRREEYPCPSWSQWHGQNLCSATCGTGHRIERRYCTNSWQNLTCAGNSTRVIDCNTQTCPTWSSWAVSSKCTTTCGPGEQLATRVCRLEGRDVTGCEGPSNKVVKCDNTIQCPYQWNAWSSFGKCFMSSQKICVKQRTRKYINEDVNVIQSNCNGDSVETHFCSSDIDNHTCSEQYSEWATWSSCDITCGTWTTIERKRSCLTTNCDPDLLLEFKLCKPDNCDRAADNQQSEIELTRRNNRSSWSPWSACFRATGYQGYQYRAKNCTSNDQRLTCDSESVERKQCTTFILSWSSWQNWDSSTYQEMRGIQNGLRTRYRTCLKRYSIVSQNDNSVFDRSDSTATTKTTVVSSQLCHGGHNASFETNYSNITNCSSQWANWSAWSRCSSTCGLGIKVSRRNCVGFDISSCVGASQRYSDCISPPCWSSWSLYSPCTKSCGDTGIKKRTRSCHGEVVVATLIAHTCEGNNTEFQRCNTQVCPLWGSWSNYTPCSKTCGIGIQSKSRSCLRGICEGKSTFYRGCRDQECPMWASWSKFSCCSVSCGQGVKTRKRKCLHEIPGYAECTGKAFEDVFCDSGSCNVTNISSSTYSCGIGSNNSAQSKRLVLLKIFNGKNTTIEKWPWQVSLQQNNCTQNGQDEGYCRWVHMCGGSMVAAQWVISAAHCTKHTPMSVISHDHPGNHLSIVLGSSVLYPEQENLRMGIRRIIVHPGYYYDQYYTRIVENDIELIKLEKPVQFSRTISPVCLPEINLPAEQSTCYVIGWGRTGSSFRLSSVLREANIPLLNFQTCQRLGYFYEHLNESLHMCAGDPTSASADTCRGDSGGPLVCKQSSSNSWYIKGITSFTFEKHCRSGNHVGIYTAIINYTNWIRRTMEMYRGC